MRILTFLLLVLALSVPSLTYAIDISAYKAWCPVVSEGLGPLDPSQMTCEKDKVRGPIVTEGLAPVDSSGYTGY